MDLFYLLLFIIMLYFYLGSSNENKRLESMRKSGKC